MRSLGRSIAAVSLVLLLSHALAATAAADKRAIRFGGEVARVPASWPVVRLAERPRLCVRMDRRVVYVGRPSAAQRCPAEAVGRERAILIDGAAATASRARSSAIAPVAGGSAYTGLGFDACTAPSSRSMRAWKASSPYEAIGVYIGGINRACSQPNLTASWVEEQVAAGWHLIPTYVGLQATTSSCTSCAELSPSAATAQGIAAADDAVADASAIGMGPGSPLYFDMESYTRTASATSSTLTFLSAWTRRLHALGYSSGVYSSSASGIADLADAAGSLHTLPDHLWIANWNGRRSTDDPFVPASLWSERQRIHQYRGGHDETWGGVTINIDNNYLDGGTVGPGAAPVALPPLTVSRVRPQAGTVWVTVRCGWAPETSCPGQIRLRTHVRLPLRYRAGRTVRARMVRLGVAHRAFRLGGGRSHSFRVALNSRGRPLLRLRGSIKAQLLVAIPGARAVRTVLLSRP
jgi:hypothetical protein